jgi:MFS family permease
VITATAVGKFSPSAIPEDSCFAALRSRGYRIYLLGQSLANAGTWMQSIAQDWLVLRLTNSATAVGLTMAFQFLPILLLGVHGGLLADRLPKRRVLLATQSANAVLAATLAALTISAEINVTQVYAFALLSGLVFVVDAPTRQAFVSEVVSPQQLRGAVSLNAAVFQSTRLVGPALAGLLIETAGTGWAFAANALCYLGPTVGLLRLRGTDLRPAVPAPREADAVRAALRYVRARPRVACAILLVGVVGTLGLNDPVVLTAMASTTFHGGAGKYAVFNIALAIGSVCGALLAAAGMHTRLRLIVLTAALFGLAQVCAAAAPDLAAFLALLLLMGLTNVAFQAIANSSVQMWVEPAMRGRVMGLYMLVFAGGTPVGAPIIGAVTNSFGPRVGMAVCGLAPMIAAIAVVLVKLRAARLYPVSL